MVTPAPAAADVEAPLTEWPEKIDTSMPANLKVSFNQRAMVHEATGLWGFLIATNSLLESLGRKVAVRASYCHRVATGHKPVLCGNEGKKNSLRTLPCDDCFVKAAGRKATPSGL